VFLGRSTEEWRTFARWVLGILMGPGELLSIIFMGLPPDKRIIMVQLGIGLCAIFAAILGSEVYDEGEYLIKVIVCGFGASLVLITPVLSYSVYGDLSGYPVVKYLFLFLMFAFVGWGKPNAN